MRPVDILREIVQPVWGMTLLLPGGEEWAARLQLGWRIEAGTPTHAYTDASRAVQIINNLLHNACKFSSGGPSSGDAAAAGGGAVSLEVSLVDDAPAAEGEAAQMPRSSRPTTRWLSFKVTDTGIGIHPADIPLLFEPFTQLDSASDREFRGTGLGLAIGQRIARSLGGRIECRSEGLGKGAAFTLLLPHGGGGAAGEAAAAAAAGAEGCAEAGDVFLESVRSAPVVVDEPAAATAAAGGSGGGRKSAGGAEHWRGALAALLRSNSGPGGGGGPERERRLSAPSRRQPPLAWMLRTTASRSSQVRATTRVYMVRDCPRLARCLSHCTSYP